MEIISVKGHLKMYRVRAVENVPPHNTKTRLLFQSLFAFFDIAFFNR